MTVNYCSLTVNYHGILTLEIIGFFAVVIYHGKLPRYFYNIGPRCENISYDVTSKTLT